MPAHDLIVIGGSAGSIDALQTILAELPADLPATICVVVHTSPYLPSHLADVLQRESALPVTTARDDAPLARGIVYAAPPDQHFMVRPGWISLARGPKENRTRPAVDPLFRSAALHYGPRVIGVVLSGALDDGTAGLWTVKDRGGIAVVQDPSDALMAGMPGSALANVAVDYVAPARVIGQLLSRLATV